MNRHLDGRLRHPASGRCFAYARLTIVVPVTLLIIFLPLYLNFWRLTGP